MHAKKSKQMIRTRCWLRKSNWNENESVRTMHKNEKDGYGTNFFLHRSSTGPWAPMVLSVNGNKKRLGLM